MIIIRPVAKKNAFQGWHFLNEVMIAKYFVDSGSSSQGAAAQHTLYDTDITINLVPTGKYITRKVDCDSGYRLVSWASVLFSALFLTGAPPQFDAKGRARDVAIDDLNKDILGRSGPDVAKAKNILWTPFRQVCPRFGDTVRTIVFSFGLRGEIMATIDHLAAKGFPGPIVVVNAPSSLDVCPKHPKHGTSWMMQRLIVWLNEN